MKSIVTIVAQKFVTLPVRFQHELILSLLIINLTLIKSSYFLSLNTRMIFTNKHKQNDSATINFRQSNDMSI
jgi:hypothetical protein